MFRIFSPERGKCYGATPFGQIYRKFILSWILFIRIPLSGILIKFILCVLCDFAVYSILEKDGME
jgi:hypothetical protein